ncbi:MAG: hypothetical protein ACRDY2_11025 [Acidimicrobiales bacterium]
MTSYAFLTDEWVEQVRLLREEYRVRMRPVRQAVRMNLVITEVPFGAGNIDASFDTTSGDIEMDVGHLEKVDLSVTLDYLTARALFVEGNQGTVMQAWMAGKIKVEGDMQKLLIAMQTTSVDVATVALAARIKEVTS